MKQHAPDELPPQGRYKHFKGNTYKVIGIVYDADEECVKVLYQSEWDYSYYCRRASEWYKPVFLIDGSTIERFMRID